MSREIRWKTFYHATKAWHIYFYVRPTTYLYIRQVWQIRYWVKHRRSALISKAFPLHLRPNHSVEYVRIQFYYHLSIRQPSNITQTSVRTIRISNLTANWQCGSWIYYDDPYAFKHLINSMKFMFLKWVTAPPYEIRMVPTSHMHNIHFSNRFVVHSFHSPTNSFFFLVFGSVLGGTTAGAPHSHRNSALRSVIREIRGNNGAKRKT